METRGLKSLSHFGNRGPFEPVPHRGFRGTYEPVPLWKQDDLTGVPLWGFRGPHKPVPFRGCYEPVSVDWTSWGYGALPAVRACVRRLDILGIMGLTSVTSLCPSTGHLVGLRGLTSGTSLCPSTGHLVGLRGLTSGTSLCPSTGHLGDYGALPAALLM